MTQKQINSMYGNGMTVDKQNKKLMQAVRIYKIAHKQSVEVICRENASHVWAYWNFMRRNARHAIAIYSGIAEHGFEAVGPIRIVCQNTFATNL